MQWHTCRIYTRLVFMLSSSWNLQNSATVVLLGPQNISKDLHRSWVKICGFAGTGYFAILVCRSFHVQVSGPLGVGGEPSIQSEGHSALHLTDRCLCTLLHAAFPSSLNRSGWPSCWKTPRQHGQEGQTTVRLNKNHQWITEQGNMKLQNQNRMRFQHG